MKRGILILLFLLSSITSAADIKYSAALRNAQVNTIEPTVGPNPILRLCGGSTPSTVSSPDGGVAYVTMRLPVDWANTATDGEISKTSNHWQALVKFSGAPTHFRIYSEDGTTPHIQGPLSITAGIGKLQIPNANLVAGKLLRVGSFTITAGSDVLSPPAAPNRMQYSIALQNAKLNVIESVIGPSGFVKLITGAIPPSVSASDPGVTVATMPLGADWLGTASGGVISTLATIVDTSADATGAATHASFVQSNGTTKHIQVDVTGTGGTGVIKLSNTNVVAGDNVSVAAPITLTAGNQ